MVKPEKHTSLIQLSSLLFHKFILYESAFGLIAAYHEHRTCTNKPAPQGLIAQNTDRITVLINCWNIIYKGIQQNPDVFSYMIKAKTSCESYVFRKGIFALVR